MSLDNDEDLKKDSKYINYSIQAVIFGVSLIAAAMLGSYIGKEECRKESRAEARRLEDAHALQLSLCNTPVPNEPQIIEDNTDEPAPVDEPVLPESHPAIKEKLLPVPAEDDGEDYIDENAEYEPEGATE